MQVSAVHFKRKAAEKLRDDRLQKALEKLQSKFVDGRAAAIAELPNFHDIRDAAAEIRARTIDNLDDYLMRFEQEATARGATVHWAEAADDANRIVADIAAQHGVRRIVKSKSMVSEDCGLNDFLESRGLDVLETDLGEYILQLAHEPPSHIVAPVVHKSKEEISDLFEEKHRRTRTTEIAELCREAREVLRPGFLAADMGISGANFIVAETGSALIVTNEGNGRLATTLPRVHVAITGIEKVVPTLEDVSTLLRLLPRSATGQSITNYVSVLTGVRGKDESDGPEHFHIVLLDNGRSRLLGTELQPMLRCIRCGACMNHCPVYQNIGGHAYGWVYPGPMGSVLTPTFVGLENALDLPNASTFCGECAVVCPVKIPLPDLMRHLRNRQTERGLRPWTERAALRLWSWMAQRPKVYALFTRIAARTLNWAGGRGKLLHYLPGVSGWTRGRDMPAPAGRTFRDLYRERRAS
jgi:L-lactate dehydrogenase complex protein LldF